MCWYDGNSDVHDFDADNNGGIKDMFLHAF